MFNKTHKLCVNAPGICVNTDPDVLRFALHYTSEYTFQTNDSSVPPSVPGADLCGERSEESGERLRMVVSAAQRAESRRAARPHHLPDQAGVRPLRHAGYFC